jgi:hypothetical protein
MVGMRSAAMVGMRSAAMAGMRSAAMVGMRSSAMVGMRSVAMVGMRSAAMVVMRSAGATKKENKAAANAAFVRQKKGIRRRWRLLFNKRCNHLPSFFCPRNPSQRRR